MHLAYKIKYRRIIMALAAFLTFASMLVPGKCIHAEDTYAPIEYMIRPGDTLGHLSQRFNISVEDILGLNPGIVPENLKVYSKIKLDPPEDLGLHHIKWGDTLWRISQKYSVSIKDIADKNFITNPDLIYAGDILAVPLMQKVTLYFIKSTETDFYLVPETRNVITGAEIYKNTLEELIKGPMTKGAFMPIPESTKVLGVAVKFGVAYPNFSDDIYRSNVGSSSEALTLMALANTLTEFPEITGVYPLVNGKPMGTLGGHIEIEEPLKRAESVIRK